MSLIKFIKNLFKSKETKEREAKARKERIAFQFLTMFEKLSKSLKEPKHYRAIDFKIGVYRFEGGWLGNDIYFDIIFKHTKFGRIVVGPQLFDPGIRHHSIYSKGVEDIRKYKSWIKESPELNKEDLALSINNVIPNLIEIPDVK